MLHFVTSYMKQNKSCKQTLESVQNGLEISFKLKKSSFGTSQGLHCTLKIAVLEVLNQKIFHKKVLLPPRAENISSHV